MIYLIDCTKTHLTSYLIEYTQTLFHRKFVKLLRFVTFHAINRNKRGWWCIPQFKSCTITQKSSWKGQTHFYFHFLIFFSSLKLRIEYWLFVFGWHQIPLGQEIIRLIKSFIIMEIIFLKFPDLLLISGIYWICIK